MSVKAPTFADDPAACINCGEPTSYRVGGVALCWLRAACKQQPQPPKPPPPQPRGAAAAATTAARGWGARGGGRGKWASKS